MSQPNDYYRMGLERGKNGCDTPLDIFHTIDCDEREKRAASAGWRAGLTIFKGQELANEAADERKLQEVEESDDSDSIDEVDDDDSLKLSLEEYDNFKKLESKLFKEEAAEAKRKEQQRRIKAQREAEEKRKVDEIWSIVRDEFKQALAVGGDIQKLGYANEEPRKSARMLLCVGVCGSLGRNVLFLKDVLKRTEDKGWTSKTRTDDFCYVVMAEHYLPIIEEEYRRLHVDRIDSMRDYEVLENKLPFTLDLANAFQLEDVIRKIRRRASYVVTDYSGPIEAFKIFGPVEPSVVTVVCAPNIFSMLLIYLGFTWFLSEYPIVRLKRSPKTLGLDS